VDFKEHIHRDLRWALGLFGFVFPMAEESFFSYLFVITDVMFIGHLVKLGLFCIKKGRFVESSLQL